MTMTDPVADLLTRIRNGQLRGLAKIKSPNSRLRASLLDVLKEEGFIREYTEVEHASGKRELEIELKYHEGQPVIRELKRVSTPGRRVYTSVKDLKPHRQGLGVSIVSTPQGVMTDTHAREKNVAAKSFARCSEELTMSRIGKNPVALPAGVTATVDGQTVKVKGPKGELKVTLVPEVSASLGANGITVTPNKDMDRAPAMWGLSRSLVNNLVVGVTAGFTTKLEIQGVGYRAAVQGKNLNLQLGFSHDVAYPIPDGIAITAEKPTQLTVTGMDKQLVGQVAAEIRAYRKPEPYKGKGVRYVGEYVRRKEGKKK